MNLTLLLALAILVLMLPVLSILWLVTKAIKKTRELFRQLAIRLNGEIVETTDPGKADGA